jgi:hypothetical protein
MPRFVDEVNAKVDLVQSMVSTWEKAWQLKAVQV